MKCILLFLGFYLIGEYSLKVECSTEREKGHKLQLKPEHSRSNENANNGSTSVQEHFGANLISVLQETITNLLSPANTQTISFLLTLLPTFPPAAIIGSFIMVILSILQSPSALSLIQKILPKVTSLFQNSPSISIPEDFIDIDRNGINVFEAIKKAVKYGPELVNQAFQFTNVETTDASLNHNLHPKLDRFTEVPKLDDRTKKFVTRKMHTGSDYEERGDITDI